MTQSLKGPVHALCRAYKFAGYGVAVFGCFIEVSDMFFFGLVKSRMGIPSTRCLPGRCTDDCLSVLPNNHVFQNTMDKFFVSLVILEIQALWPSFLFDKMPEVAIVRSSPHIHLYFEISSLY